jgi:hypothetical protein
MEPIYLELWINNISFLLAKASMMNVLTHRETFTSKLTTKQREFMKELLIGTEDEKATNPYSQEEVMLCAEAIAVYDYLKGAERLAWDAARAGNYMSEEDADKFDMAKDIFITNWPKEYIILLD